MMSHHILCQYSAQKPELSSDDMLVKYVTQKIFSMSKIAKLIILSLPLTLTRVSIQIKLQQNKIILVTHMCQTFSCVQYFCTGDAVLCEITVSGNIWLNTNTFLAC